MTIWKELKPDLTLNQFNNFKTLNNPRDIISEKYNFNKNINKNIENCSKSGYRYQLNP